MRVAVGADLMGIGWVPPSRMRDLVVFFFGGRMGIGNVIAFGCALARGETVVYHWSSSNCGLTVEFNARRGLTYVGTKPTQCG